MEYLNSGIAWFAQVAFNTLFTAADENLPLSMVRVKNKPQHLVFSSHFVHQLSKPRPLPVETSIQPCWSRVSMAVENDSNLEQSSGVAPGPVASTPQP